MEIVKEVRINSKHADCTIESQSIIHINLRGSLNNLFHKDMFVSVKDVEIPQITKSINFKMYYGPKKESPTVLSYNLKYKSFSHLCLLVTESANYYPRIACLKSGIHKDHICDDFDMDRLSLSLEYKDNVFIMKLPKGWVLYMSDNLSKLMGFDKTESSGMVLFEERIQISDDYQNSYLKSAEKKCHFCFENLSSHMYHDGNFYSVLFTYDMELKECNEKSCVHGFKRIKNVENLKFFLLNDAMRPYDFNCDLRKFPITFTLIFYMQM